jgi:hypothetical protein
MGSLPLQAMLPAPQVMRLELRSRLAKQLARVSVSPQAQSTAVPNANRSRPEAIASTRKA